VPAEQTELVTLQSLFSTSLEAEVRPDNLVGNIARKRVIDAIKRQRAVNCGA
jgi:hypothetical protein